MFSESYTPLVLEAISALSGVIVGGAVAWLLATSRARLSAERDRSALQAKLAAADGAAAEAHRQQAKQESDIAALRSDHDVQRQARTTAETRLTETLEHVEAQRRLLEDAEKRLKDSFDSLAAKALQQNSEQFAARAQKSLEVVLADAKGDLGKREEAIKGLVTPLAERLQSYDTQLKVIETARQSAYGSLKAQVDDLNNSNLRLQKETGNLVMALRDPKTRGRWGELALRRTAELAGMTENCDFDLQVSSRDEDGGLRPDMIVSLPGGRTIVVDAKTVLDAYLSAVACSEEEGRKRFLVQHAQQVRSRVGELSSKRYWDRLSKGSSTPEFVVLFLPGEAFFSAAVETDGTLLEDAIGKRVVLASPTTLIALLRAVAYGWQQHQLTENAEQIRVLGKELFDRLVNFTDHLDKLGKGLTSAVNNYNQAVGSLETRVLVSARHLKELGVSGSGELKLEPIDRMPRMVESRTDLP